MTKEMTPDQAAYLAKGLVTEEQKATRQMHIQQEKRKEEMVRNYAGLVEAENFAPDEVLLRMTELGIRIGRLRYPNYASTASQQINNIRKIKTLWSQRDMIVMSGDDRHGDKFGVAGMEFAVHNARHLFTQGNIDLSMAPYPHFPHDTEDFTTLEEAEAQLRGVDILVLTGKQIERIKTTLRQPSSWESVPKTSSSSRGIFSRFRG